MFKLCNNKIFYTFALTLLFFCQTASSGENLGNHITLITPPSATAPKSLVAANELYTKGFYQEAYDAFEQQLNTTKYRGEDAALALNGAIASLKELRKLELFDTLIDKVIRIYPNDGAVLNQAAAEYLTITHSGYQSDLPSNAFQRGSNVRIGQYCNTGEYDRLRSLYWSWQAYTLAKKNKNKLNRVNALHNLANALTYNRTPYSTAKLFELSDLGSVKNQSPCASSTKALDSTLTLENLFNLPDTWQNARSDGERWRFVLHQLSQISDSEHQQADYEWANFLWQHFGVHTLARHFPIGQGKTYERFQQDLQTLGDNQLYILKDNTPIKIELTPDTQFIRLLKSICHSTKATLASHKAALLLATLYENRQQFENSSTYLKHALATYDEKYYLQPYNAQPYYPQQGHPQKHDDNQKKIIENKIAQIHRPWGQFIHSESGQIELDYRNAEAVTFTLYALDTEGYLNELQNNIEHGDNKTYPSFKDIGLEAIQANEKRFIKQQLSTWTSQLAPPEGHLNAVIQVDMPEYLIGAHLLKAEMQNGNSTYLILWQSQRILLKKQQVDSTLYYLGDSRSGKGQSKTRLYFWGYNRNKHSTQIKTFSATTNRQGFLTVKARQLSPDFEWIVYSDPTDPGFVYHGFESTWYDDEEELLDNTSVFIIANQPVYRPGQKLNYKGWLRIKNSRLARWRTNKLELPLVLEGPKGDTVHQQNITLDSFGAFSGTFTLPEDADLGEYTLYFDEFEEVGVHTVWVEEYKKSEFSVTITPEPGNLIGDELEFTIAANYLFGGPVTNAKVQYEIFQEHTEQTVYPQQQWDWLYGPGYTWQTVDTPWLPGWRNWGIQNPANNRYDDYYFRFAGYDRTDLHNTITGEIRLDNTGKATIKVPAQTIADPPALLEYTVEAKVTDSSRRTVEAENHLLVPKNPHTVYAWLDQGFYHSGDLINGHCLTETIHHKAVITSGTIALYRSAYSTEGAEITAAETLISRHPVQTDDAGRAQQSFIAGEAGRYRLSCQFGATDSGPIESALLFNIVSSQTGAVVEATTTPFNPLEIISDKTTYQNGDTAKLLIVSTTAQGQLLLFYKADADKRFKTLKIPLVDFQAEVSIPIQAKHAPQLILEVVGIFDGEVKTATKTLLVPPQSDLLTIALEMDQPQYLPGETALIQVKISDANGKPFHGSAALTVYDKALELISGKGLDFDIRAFFWYRENGPYDTDTAFSPLPLNFVLAQPNAQTMQPLGFSPRGYGTSQAFGYDYYSDNTILEEVIVTGIRASVAQAADIKRDSTGIVDALSSKDLGLFPDPILATTLQRLGIQPSTQAQSIRRHFQDSILWLDQIETNRAGIARIPVKLPDNIGAWQAHAWVMGKGLETGMAKKQFRVAKPLMVRLQTPRFFVATDSVTLSSNVHNDSDAARTIRVTLSVNEQHLTLLDTPTQVITVPAKSQIRADWKVTALHEGQAQITITAETVDGKTELYDAVTTESPIAVHGMLTTQNFAGSLGRNQTLKQFHFNIPAKRKAPLSTLNITYASSPVGTLLDALPYLADYPYGCTEQTLNRFLPTLTVQKLLQDYGLDLEHYASAQNNQAMQNDPEQANPVFNRDQVAQMANQGLEKLEEMQLSDGGWGWFSGFSERSSAHTTAYTIHGLLRARSYQLNVDDEGIHQGLSWLQSYQNTQYNKLMHATNNASAKQAIDNLDALVAYTLSEVDQFNNDMLNLLFQQRRNLSLYGQILLALTLNAQSDPTPALTEQRDIVIRGIKQFLEVDTENATAYLRLEKSRSWWYWYESDIETQALFLRLLTLTDASNPILINLTNYIVNNRSHGRYWSSTRDTAAAIEAIVEYVKTTQATPGTAAVTVSLDGKALQSSIFNQQNGFGPGKTLILQGEHLSSGEHVVSISKEGDLPLFYTAHVENFNREESLKKTGLEVKIERQLFRLTPVKSSPAPTHHSAEYNDQYKRTPLHNGEMLTSGELIEVVLTIDSKNDYEYILLEDMKAAGFEATEFLSGYSAENPGTYVEYRDNRVAFFMQHLSRGKKQLRYKLKAEIPGKFSALPAKIEAMYSPRLRANSDENKIYIEDDKNI